MARFNVYLQSTWEASWTDKSLEDVPSVGGDSPGIPADPVGNIVSLARSHQTTSTVESLSFGLACRAFTIAGILDLPMQVSTLPTDFLEWA